jgi:hypothetical protein
MERRFGFNIVVEPCGVLLFYFLRCLLRIMEKYIAAKAASSTPPNIRIKVVTICSPISISKIQSCKSSAASLLTKDETQPLSANPAAPQVTIDEPTSSEPAAVADSSCDHEPILPGSHSCGSTATASLLHSMRRCD